MFIYRKTEGEDYRFEQPGQKGRQCSFGMQLTHMRSAR